VDENRLAELERRVARLEDAAATAPSGKPAGSGDTFWALTTLEQDLPPGGAVLFAGAVTVPGGERYEWQETRAAGDLVGEDWSTAASSLAALGHPVRLLLLRAVLHGAHSVADLKAIQAPDEAGSSGQIYHHLRQLLAAGWLRPAGRARYVVPPERVIPLLVIYAGGSR
jgi:hypothetical protein